MVEIKYATKTDGSVPDKYIAYVGGIRKDGSPWKLTEEAVIRSSERNVSFYVTVNNKRLRVIVANHHGHRFLKTVIDQHKPYTLLKLPECP